MGEILPDGSIQGYFMSCDNCGKDIEVNMQGDTLDDHLCRCPECMNPVNKSELDMFGGLCEECNLMI